LAGIPQNERVAYSNEVAELRRKVKSSIAAIDEMIVATGAIKESLLQSTASTDLYADAQALEMSAKKLRNRLMLDKQRDGLGDPGPLPVSRRLTVAGYGAMTTAHGPTATQRRSFEIAQEEFAEIYQQLEDLIGGQFNALQEHLEAAGVPWTPGRGLPLED
jgi:hypothetical protein